MKKILVIAPHADDEVLGMGGTIAKHSQSNNEVYVLIATNAHKGDENMFSEAGINLVRNEALQAHEILGVTNTFFLDFPAPRLNAFPFYKISVEFNKIIDKVNPDILYLPHPGDLHLDHHAIYMAALVSARPQNGCSVKEIYCYETLSETEWAPYQGDKHFKPNLFEAISEYMDKKIKAMSCFQSQLKDQPHTRSLSSIKALARYRGGTVNVQYAESFEIERVIEI